MADSEDTPTMPGSRDVRLGSKLDFLDALDETRRLTECAIMATDSIDDTGARDPLASLLDVISLRLKWLGTLGDALDVNDSDADEARKAFPSVKT